MWQRYCIFLVYMVFIISFYLFILKRVFAFVVCSIQTLHYFFLYFFLRLEIFNPSTLFLRSNSSSYSFKSIIFLLPISSNPLFYFFLSLYLYYPSSSYSFTSILLLFSVPLYPLFFIFFYSSI